MYIDLIFFAIIAITVFVCYKRGLALSLFSSLSSLLSIVLVYVLKNPVSQFLKNSAMGKSMYNKIFEIVKNKFANDTGSLIDESNVPGIFADILKSENKLSNSVVAYMTDRVFDLLILIVTFLLVYFIIKLVTKISPKIIKIITNLPVIKQFDKGLGLCFGLVSGVIWSIIFVYIVNVLAIYINSEFLGAQVVASYVSKLLNIII